MNSMLPNRLVLFGFKISTLLLFIGATFQLTFAQCDSLVRMTNENVSHINSPWQLTFLHQPPQNEVDRIVADLTGGVIKDSMEYVKLIDRLGATHTQEAFALLYTCICRPLFIHDLNPFNGLCGTLSFYGGYKVLNKYFLANSVDNHLPYYEFAAAVIQKCKPMEPVCFYCQPPDYIKEYKKQLSKIYTAPLDTLVAQTINYYGEMGMKKGYGLNTVLDSIYYSLVNFENLGNIVWDTCKTFREPNPEEIILGIVLMVDEQPVEKLVKVHMIKINQNADVLTRNRLYHLQYDSSEIAPNGIQKLVDNCEINEENRP